MTNGANHLHVHRRRKRRKYRHFIALGVEDIKPRPDKGSNNFIAYIRMVYLSDGIQHRHINRYARTASVFYRRKPLKRKNNNNCSKHYRETVTGDK